MHSKKRSEEINLEKKTRPERMFSEHEQDGEAGREAAAAQGRLRCWRKPSVAEEITSTGLKSDARKKLFSWEWEQDPRMINSTTDSESKLIQI